MTNENNLPILQELQLIDAFEKSLNEYQVKQRASLRTKEPWFHAVAAKWINERFSKDE